MPTNPIRLMDHNPYLSPQQPTVAASESAPLRHSGLGIASFATALGTVLLVLVPLAAGIFVELSTPGWLDTNPPMLMLLGLGIIGGAFIDLVAIGLGIAALFERDRKRLFAVLGIVIAGAMLSGLSLLMVLGSMG